MFSSIDLRTSLNHLIFMGDSLSDRYTFAKRKILYGIIPNNWIVDLSKSPHGRFTNGYTWDDYVCAMLVNKFLVADIENKLRWDATDVADAVEDDDPHVKPEVQAEDTLQNDNEVDAEGERYARTYCEGGLSAHDYSSEWLLSPTLMTARKIVSTLNDKRRLLLEDDKKLAIGLEEKKNTLIIEWSGGNDFITVNFKPTREEADKAVAARMENIEKLYENGYRNFVLANLPDLSATPRFQALTNEDRKNATEVCNYFNDELAKRCQELRSRKKDLSLHIFNTNAAFKEIDDHPEKYGIDPLKKTQPYTTSKDFVINKDGTSPAKGYMFWDDIHPTARMHAEIGKLFSAFINKIYTLTPPLKTNDTDPKYMVKKFLHEYHKILRAEQGTAWKLYGAAQAARLPHDAIETEGDYPRVLADILYHGMNENGVRTLDILKKLGWVNQTNEINWNNEGLEKARPFYKNKTKALNPNL